MHITLIADYEPEKQPLRGVHFPSVHWLALIVKKEHYPFEHQA